ncbi:MAG: GDP-mannose 4,6-dehydratase, partial [Bacteriovorax sp.]
VKVAFDYFNLDYRKYLVIDESLIRPNEIKFNVGDNRDALEILGWSSKVKFKDIINSMIESKITSDFKI